MEEVTDFSQTSDFYRLFAVTPSKYETFFGTLNIGTSLVTSALQDHSTKISAVSALLDAKVTHSNGDISNDSSPGSPNRAKENGFGLASPAVSDSETDDNDPQVSHLSNSPPTRRKRKRVSKQTVPDHLIEKGRLLSGKEQRESQLSPDELEEYELRIERMLQKDFLSRKYYNTKIMEGLERIENHIEDQTQQHKNFTDAFINHTRFIRERLESLDREKEDECVGGPRVYGTKEGVLVFTPAGFNEIFKQQAK